MNAQQTLKYYFGYPSFRSGQEQIVETILSGQDALAIMPTGAGKSICYQVPALMLPGITLVVSPLISLMQDQVKALNEAGIHAAYINSSLTEAQVSYALELAAQGRFKIIYVAPERLESSQFLRFAKHADISMVTVDEAHCISQWGQDFRPSYVRITQFVEELARRPIVSAFTATATQEVKEDILCTLKLQDPNVVVTGFDRENLYYQVETTRRKDDYVSEYVAEHADESGIIYCATRKNVDALFELLFKKGVAVTRYHAGMNNEERKKSQDDFIYDRTPVIVATNAFGMGIDKSNVRYVIHYNMPQSMENYYQEAGRAGRDGEASRCILLFSPQDVMIARFLLEKKDFTEVEEENIELIRQRDIHRLQVMENYCRTTECLRNYILAYFGEKTGVACDHCGNCHRHYKEVDMTFEAKWVINCVAETRGRYGLSIVLGTLSGANRARLRELGTTEYKSYGALSDCNEAAIRILIHQMILDGYLIQTEGKYSVLQLGDIAPLKAEDAKVFVRMHEEAEEDKKKPARFKKSTDSLTGAGYALFEKLRGLRLSIAREESVPPYIVFNDKTLIDMCVKLPRDEEELLNVSGVGRNKCEKYGQRFLEGIEEYLAEHPGSLLSMNVEEEKPGRKEYPDFYTGYGEEGRAADEVSFLGSHRDEYDEMIYSARQKKKSPRKSRKADFYLKPQDAEEFEYADLYYMSSIKEELDRICSASDAKKADTKDIWSFLTKEGLTRMEKSGRTYVKVSTKKGEELGIQTIHKVGKGGIEYDLLMYPPGVQKMIVEHYVKA